MHFIGRILIFLNILVFILCKCYHADTVNDYIVVGAGTAGSIVAARLVEANQRVLVVEAGDEPPEETTTSRIYTKFLRTEIDWQFQTEPQTDAFLSTPDRTTTLSAGKVMGGSGTINGMAYTRGNKKDYKKWEKMGAAGWNYKSFVKYIKKIEDSHLTGIYDQKDHNKGGKIKITNEGNDQKILEAFSEAIRNEGYNYTDPNDGKASGVGPMQFNYYNNRRQSTYLNYLKPLKGNENLSMLSGFLVQKVKYDSTISAVVAELLNPKTGEIREEVARKEIILCAGAINTPQILMLSGIGPEEELTKLNIPVISNRPVGKNLPDHFGVFSAAFVKPGEDTNGAAIAFIKSDDTQQQSDIEVVQFLRGNLSIVGTILTQVKSKGEIRLRSLNIMDKPIVDPKYFSNKNDLQRLGKALKFSVELRQKMDISKSGYVEIPFKKPEACKNEAEDSDQQWQCVVQHIGTCLHHPVGTARMGAENSNDAVVDPNLKVIGLERVRVVDASVMPSIVSANPQVAVMAIAEKGSELIIADEANF